MKAASFNSIYVFVLVFLIQTSIFSQDNNTGTHEQWEYILEDTGDVLQIALPIIAGATTLIKKDWEGTKQFTLSYGTGFLVTHALKKIIKKKRPEGRNSFNAFPSGHTTSAFSGASFIQRRYGWKYGKWAYLGAITAGVSRMEGPDGWHDIWDVLGGALVGIGSTYLFTCPYTKDHLEISYTSKNNYYLLGVRYRF